MSGGAAPSAEVQDAQPPVLTRSARIRTLGRIVFRLAVHLAAWAPLVTGGVEGMRLHWRPIGDGAAIALRSWDVLTAHGPLVGQATRLANGVYDPGPLQYWLQAIPVRLDPGYGVLWGAALWCVIAASLAIEAAWSALGWRGGVAAAGAILGIVVWQPLIALQPFWNPWFGAMFFLAALAAGWAVLCGRRRWWVVLVVAGSVAAQAHLVYALASAALVVLALAVGVVDSLRAKAGYRWAVAGLLACAGCWSAPIVQEINGRPGNLTLLLDSQGTGTLTGAAFGFKAVAAATQPPPVWWASSHALAWLGAASAIAHRSPGFAVAALALTAASFVVAIRPLRSRPLAALAALSLLDSGAAVFTYADIPVKNTSLRTLSYLDVLTYPVGVLCWLTVGAAAVLTAHRLIRRLPSRPAVAGPDGAPSGGAARPATLRAMRPAAALAALRAVRRPAAAPGVLRAVRPAAALAAAVVLAVASFLAVTRRAPAADTAPGSVIGAASQQIEGALHRQQVALVVTDSQLTSQVPVAMGIAWALKAAGYRPELLSQHAARLLGWGYLYGGQHIPLVEVHVRSTGVKVRIAPAGWTVP